MPIQPSERIIYKTNPLIDVACQLNFPPILKIDSHLPANFQDALRRSYPIFEESVGAGIKFNLGARIGGEEKNEILSFLEGEKRTFSFLTEDKSRGIILTRDFLAFKTNKYITWGLFKEWFEEPLSIFVKEYQPSFFSRIGLRYKDLIVRSDLGIDDEPWNELLVPEFAAEFTLKDLSNEIISKSGQVIFELENDIKLILNHGLAKKKSTNEQCYLIDSDFSTIKRTEVNDAFNKLGEFNKLSGNFFRLCISEKLTDALGREDTP